MNVFYQLSMKYKLSLLVIPVLVTLVLYTGIMVSTLNRTAGIGQTIAELSQVSVFNSKLVHELQKERGLTAGFLGGGGAGFHDKLRQQREQTNQVFKNWSELIKVKKETGVLDSLESVYRRIDNDLDKLKTIRQKVDKQNIPIGEALGYYTGLNAKLLDVAKDIAALAERGEMVRLIHSYAFFLLGKERAGIERAVLSNTFSADKFGPGMFQKFVTLVADQNTYLGLFRKTASPQALAVFKSHASHPSFAEVERYRTIAQDGMRAGGFNTSGEKWFATATQRINQLKAIEDKLSEDLILAARHQSEQASAELWFYSVISVAVFAGSVLVALLIIRLINRQVDNLQRCMQQVVDDHDFTVRAEVIGNDEIAQVTRRFNTMLENLVDFFTAISLSSEQLTQSAHEVASTVEHSNHNVQLQKDESNLLVAAVNELAATSQDVAENIQRTASAATEANDTTQNSNNAVREAVRAINALSSEVTQVGDIVAELNQNSESISGVLDVIKSVAEQTNLLALNAAIEAARAGEQGRGFAVVADEVRSLAQRTQESAQEIEEIIHRFQSDASSAHSVISNGQETARQAVTQAESIAQMLDSINHAIATIHDMTHQIATATEEQVAVNEEVNKNIVRIDGMGQENAAGFAQISSSTREQANLAASLRERVSKFKIGEEKEPVS